MHYCLHKLLFFLALIVTSMIAKKERKKVLLFAALLFSLFFLPSSILEARLPTRVEGDTPRRYWQFIFLLEETRAPGQHEFHFHPFYGRYSNLEKAYRYHYFLYPIFYSHGTNYWQHWTWLYFFTGDDFYHQDKGRDSDLLLGGIFNLGWGSGPEDRYFGLFPIYGRFRQKLSYDEINYILFPLYVNWSYRDYKAHSILWPLTMRGKSSKRSDLRILPFFSFKTHRNRYRRYSILWPFFQWGHEGLDKKEPRHYFFSFPLFGRKWSDQNNLSVYSFLWLPFLGSFVAYGRDDRSNAKELNLLWFLFHYHRNDDPIIRRLMIFPFYARYHFGSSEQIRLPYYKEGIFITPLYANLRTYSATLDSDYKFVVPFYWNMDRYYHKEREVESYVKFWPLFQYISDSEGRREFRSLVLWPFRSDQFERAWGPLYSLVEYNTYSNGDRYFSLLLRLYSRYWNEEESHHFIAGVEWSRTPDYWSLQLLKGLLGYQRHYRRDGEPYSLFKLFWFTIGDG